MTKLSNKELQKKSVQYRMDILKYIKMAGAGHTGGSLSCIDILNVLYNEVLQVTPESFSDPHRDRYIQSKGHSVEALYVVLADRGFFPGSDLETLCQYKSDYIGHPTRKVNGIEFNTGSLGHGLSISAGIALGAKKDNARYKTFTLIGDGELAEGSNWEAAMMAVHYKLDNLVVILDHNALQITGPIREVCSPYPINQKFKAFGWNVLETNGNDVTSLKSSFDSIDYSSGKPTFLIANTKKGCGVTFMENEKKWHHGVPTDQEYELAIKQLNAKLNEFIY